MPTMGPQHATCETDSEGEEAYRTPTKSTTSRKRSQSTTSSLTARREPKPEPRRESSKNSDSGYSTGTKASEDASAADKPVVVEQEEDEEEEEEPSTPKRLSRPAEKRTTSSKSEVSQRSAKSTKSRTPRPEKREEEPRAEEPKRERGPSRSSTTARPPKESLSRHGSVRTSPTSSRSSRAPSSSSREEMPPPQQLPVRPRVQTDASVRTTRPSSYHGAMGTMESYYSTPGSYSAYDHGYGPPPSRSAYSNIRPGPSVLTPGTVYSAPGGGHSQALQPSLYDPSRMALRAQTDSVTQVPAYSARRPLQVYPDQPSPYEQLSAPEPPSPERSPHHRKIVSARRPADPPPYGEHVFDDEYSGSDSGSYDEDEYDENPQPSAYAQRQGQRGEIGYASRIQARGMGYPGTYGSSPQDYFHPHPGAYEYYPDSQSDYRSSVRSKTTGSGSSRSRRQSLSSSGAGTKATSYSASSGSGRRQSMYSDTLDNTAEAELYMRSKDRQAQYVRTQQPQLTQESLRLAQARQLENKRSSRVGGVSVASSKQSSSYRSQSRTITCADEQAVKIRLDTSAGMDLQLEGDTEGRPIRLVQQPGDTFAQLVIGTGVTKKAETVYNAPSGSSGRTRDSGERGSSRVSRESEKTSRSSRAAVSGRRERARTMVDL